MERRMRNTCVPALCEVRSRALRAHCVEWPCFQSLCLCVSWIAEFAKEKEAIALSISQQMVRHTHRMACGMRADTDGASRIRPISRFTVAALRASNLFGCVLVTSMFI